MDKYFVDTPQFAVCPVEHLSRPAIYSLQALPDAATVSIPRESIRTNWRKHYVRLPQPHAGKALTLAYRHLLQ